MGRTVIRRTLRILLFATLAAGLLMTSFQAAALPNGDINESCVRWQMVSYTAALIVSPYAKLIEYYVTFTDERGDYQTVSVLALRVLSINELATFSPFTCT